MQPTVLAQMIAKALDDKKGLNILALDVHELTVLCDCMVIATGRSVPQVRALADEVEEQLAKQGIHPCRIEGQNEARWVVLDYESVMVHIFHAEERAFYNLERLWEDGDNRLALPFDALNA